MLVRSFSWVVLLVAMLAAACSPRARRSTVVAKPTSRPSAKRPTSKSGWTLSQASAFARRVAEALRASTLSEVCFAFSEREQTIACRTHHYSVQGGATFAVRFIALPQKGAAALPSTKLAYVDDHPADGQYLDEDHPVSSKMLPKVLAAIEARLVAGHYRPPGAPSAVLPAAALRVLSMVQQRGQTSGGSWAVHGHVVELHCGARWRPVRLAPLRGHDARPRLGWLSWASARARHAVVLARSSWTTEGDGGSALRVALAPCLPPTKE